MACFSLCFQHGKLAVIVIHLAICIPEVGIVDLD